MMADTVKEALREEREKNPASMNKQLAPQDTDRPGTSSAPVSLNCLHCSRWLIRRGGACVRLLRAGPAQRSDTGDKQAVPSEMAGSNQTIACV